MHSTHTLNQNAAEVTSLAYLSVGCVYLLVVVLAILVPAPWDDRFTIGMTFSVSLLGWTGWAWTRWHPIQPHQAHAALMILTIAMAVQTGSVLFQIGEPIHSSNQVLTLLAASFFYTARSWFYPAIAVIVACWLPAAIAGLQNAQLTVDWNLWGRILLLAVALATAFFEARRRTVLRTYQLKVEAETALLEAQDANRKRLSMQGMMQESQRREALGVLAGGIAHDFNNLMAVISGNIELMSLEADPQSDEAAMLEEMQKACDRGVELTAQMLVYAGRSKPKISSIRLGDRIRSAARLFASSNPPGVRIELDGKTDGPRVSVDSTLLDQLIINLIQNAIEACARDGGVVRINWMTADLDASQLEKLRFSMQPSPGSYAIVEISDSGTGMDEHTQNKMFEPFYSTKADGNGLGLAVAAGILESHSAGVSVSSALGRGTHLRLAIPISDSAASSSRPRA